MATLNAGANAWIVVQWNLHVFGDPSTVGQRSFQAWIGVNGTEDISYAYDINALTGVSAAVGPLTTGVENLSGTGGAQITGPPTGSYVVTTPGAPGGSLTYSLKVKGTDRGNAKVTSAMTASIVPGATIVSTPIRVTK